MLQNNKEKKTLKIILCILFLIIILFALSKSFNQYCGCSLDGDIAESVLPYPGVQKTFEDPTGVKTIINNDKHWGPNRFFSHYFLHKTFRKLPLLLQNFCGPIDSVYYTSAMAKLIMQILIIFLLTAIILGSFNLLSLKFIAIFLILIPFFPTNGTHISHEIGVIDKSVTYSFFYAMPLIFLLIYYVPIFFELLHNKKIKMNWFLSIFWAVFAIIACFSGPTYPPTILITNFILFSYLFVKNWRDNNRHTLFKRIIQALNVITIRNYLFLVPISLLALYSTFLGTYNIAYSEIQLSLKALFLLLPKGILNSFTTFSYITILLLLIANYIIIFYKYRTDLQSKKIFGLYKFLILFSLIYILLLPFGGYRPYRPLIIRYDTLIPISILSITTIYYTFLYIMKQFSMGTWKHLLKITYSVLFFSILVVFALKNNTKIYNECEKLSLHIIANAKEDIVVLENGCAVVGWEPIYNPEESRPYGELLYLWNITDKAKLYYNSPTSNN
jgi:hypothetical protein